MKQIISIVVVIVASFIICELVYIPVKKGIAAYYNNSFTHFTEMFKNQTAYDMLFIGSSRTLMSIYPKPVDSICRVNSYNCGVTGARIMDCELILKGYLAVHPPPKTVVLVIDLLAFAKQNEIRQHTEYYPFLNNKGIDVSLAKYGYHPYLIKAFPFFCISELDDYNKENTIRLLLGRGDTAMMRGDIEYKGFTSPLSHIKPYGLSKVRYDIYDESLASLNEIIKTCRENKIRLIFAYAPEYKYTYQRLTTNSDSIFAVISQTARVNSIPYLRDDSLKLCDNPEFFWNPLHLNQKGAIEYSAVLAEEINAVLKQNMDSVH